MLSIARVLVVDEYNVLEKFKLAKYSYCKNCLVPENIISINIFLTQKLCGTVSSRITIVFRCYTTTCVPNKLSSKPGYSSKNGPKLDFGKTRTTHPSFPAVRVELCIML